MSLFVQRCRDIVRLEIAINGQICEILMIET
jgi:hypothetical protein